MLNGLIQYPQASSLKPGELQGGHYIQSLPKGCLPTLFIHVLKFSLCPKLLQHLIKSRQYLFPQKKTTTKTTETKRTTSKTTTIFCISAKIYSLSDLKYSQFFLYIKLRLRTPIASPGFAQIQVQTSKTFLKSQHLIQ